MKNNEIQCKKIKLILPALLLLIFLCAMPVAASSYELVANTTSDTNGYYSFEDTQNGNYTLVAMNYSDKLRAIEVDVSVNGSSVEQSLNIKSSGDAVDNIDELYGFLNRSVISGQTFTAIMGPDPVHPYVDVLLLNEQADEFISNTTSDENGYYSFEDIQNGNYTLVAMNYSDKLRAIEVDVSVNGSSVEQSLNIKSSGDAVDNIDELYGFLDRSVISGQTFTAIMGPDPLHPYVDVLLLNEQADEFISNTTSDGNGYYSFEDIQNGNYTLVAMNYSDKLRAIDVDISVNGSSVEQSLNIKSSGDPIDRIDELYGFLDRSVISGQTFTAVMGPDPVHPYVDVLLLKEKKLVTIQPNYRQSCINSNTKN